MARYLLIESRDPFEYADTNYMYDLAGDLVGKGNNVTLFLIQNGVFCARRNVKDNPVASLRQKASGVTIEADVTSLVFSWGSSSDIDGDSLGYSLRISASTWDTLFVTPDTQATVILTSSFMPDSTYNWTVEVSDGDVITQSASEFSFWMGAVLALDADDLVPQQFALYQNYPNPFNPRTTLRFDLPEIGAVRLSIYDMLGREVAVLVERQLPAGYHHIAWDSERQSSGIYIARLVTPEYTKSIKMVLLK